MKLSQAGERTIIEQIIALSGAPESSRCEILLPNGDDAAVIEVNGTKLALSVDALAEDQDFSFSYFSARQVGSKAVEAAVSDIIACGARPLLILVCVSAPPNFESTRLAEIYRGIQDSCSRLKIFTAGGDLSASAEKLSLSVTAIGTYEAADKILSRSGAKVGDLLYVSGALGGSGAALKLLQTAQPMQESLANKHLEPRCRADLLGKLREASAAIDISDGLASEIRHICRASRVGCEIDERLVPLAPGVAEAAAIQGVAAINFAFSGGEDYEILYTLPPAVTDQAEGICIGKITAGSEIIVINGDHRKHLEESGYDNFRR